jgi:hypothetical protein
MLTIFTHTKAFKGHVGLIQRNAISQWARLRPRPEILLFGNREGTAEIAQEFGLRYIPEVKRTRYGTPLLSDLFEKAHTVASHNVLCYANADMMLLGDFMWAVQQVACWRDHFLMVGRRTNVDLDEPAIYESPDQEARLLALVSRQGQMASPDWIDYFVFSRDLVTGFPPFAIGRPCWDNWFLWKARNSNIALVDASEVVLAVHQNHDNSHLPKGAQDAIKWDEAKQNRRLARGYYCTIEHATHKLGPDGIKCNLVQPIVRRDSAIRLLWWEFLSFTAPVRYPLGLRQENIARMIDRIRPPLT